VNFLARGTGELTAEIAEVRHLWIFRSISLSLSLYLYLYLCGLRVLCGEFFIGKEGLTTEIAESTELK
jgi:hypothetical protein